jgi:hypothetical protein
MKISKLLPAVLFVILSTSFSDLDVLGQEKTLLPPALNQSSSLTEILTWLDKNAFPYAQVGLRKKGGQAPSLVPFKSGNPISAQERIFSAGFQITAVDGCQVTLGNKHIAIVHSRNPSSGTFYRFIPQKNGKRELTPELALLFLPLDRMSERKGKGPHLQTGDQQKTKLLKTWQTTFDQKGLLRRSIFEMELTAAEQPQIKELGSFGYLSFSFDSKELAEQFNAAFRQAIRICGNK